MEEYDVYDTSSMESDVYRSDYGGYSSEEWNEEFVEGQKNKKRERTDRGIELVEHEVVRYDPNCPIGDIRFEAGMRFESASHLLEVVRNHAIGNGFDIKLLKSGDSKVEVVCKSSCQWRLYASWTKKKDAFVVKTLNNKHTCSRLTKNKKATYRWLANHYLERFRKNPEWPIRELMREVHQDFGIEVSKVVCYAARTLARQLIQGSVDDQSQLFRSHVKELQSLRRNRRVDPIERELDRSRVTKRGIQVTCSMCRQDGHNRRTCPARVNHPGDTVVDEAANLPTGHQGDAHVRSDGGQIVTQEQSGREPGQANPHTGNRGEPFVTLERGGREMGQHGHLHTQNPDIPSSSGTGHAGGEQDASSNM